MSNPNVIDKSRANQYRITQQPEGTDDNKDPYASKVANAPTSSTPPRLDPSTNCCMTGFCDDLGTACCCVCLSNNCDSNSGCCDCCSCDGCGDCGGCDGCGDCGGCDGCGDCGGCNC